MKFFKQENLIGWLILGCIYILIIIGYYFFRIKPARRKLETHPKIDYLGKLFGKKGVVIVYIIAMFVIFPIISYMMIGYFGISTTETNQVTTTNTEFLTQITENLNNITSEWFEYLRENPKWAGLVIAGFGLIMLISLIINADWMLEGNGGFWSMADKIEIFGKKTMRIVIAIPCIGLIIAGLLIFFLYPK
ncbi:MAG: hypothetical protein KGV59_02290 [Tenacibaculum sp.]|nr:hypothetical protein [Tenacibaculum sp.]